MLILKKLINMIFKKFLPHLISIVVFVVAAIIYFHPVLKGEKLFQSDIAQYRGMAKEVMDFREDTGTEPFWAESAFSGMPTYQLGAVFPNDYIAKLDRLVRFLPRPADYLFLYFIGFYVLLLALKVDWRIAIFGSLAFGFSTYLIIIFGAGHNAKAHTIAYMPLVLAGVFWVFQRKYLLGFTVTSLAMALQLKANHPQMTYYLLFVLLILGLVELIDALKEKKIKVFFTQASVLIFAMIIALGVNAARLLSTKEYADNSTRGKSELTINPDGSKKVVTEGLTPEYITQYSYSKLETFNLLVPRFMGGGTVEQLGSDSNTFELIESKFGKRQAEAFTEQVFTYWGEQPIIEAPAYIGAVVIFLFILGIFLVKGRIKTWLVAATVFSIVMSWGHNIFLTDLFIDYVPLYNKFRAVSSIQVIAELCVPILAVLALKEFFFSNTSSEEKIHALKKALYITGGLVFAGLIFALMSSSFEGLRDSQYLQMEEQFKIEGLLDAVRQDRKALLYSDSFRSLILIVITFGLLWIYLKKKLSLNLSLTLLSALVLFDLLSVNLRYVSPDDFISARKVEKPFTPTNADKQILKDTSHYRVANLTTDPFQDATTSYFHKSIGGYHAAKMGRYQDLIEFQLLKNNREVFNMLNVKYFIFPSESGEPQAQINPGANGNAWFVQEIKTVSNANEEIKVLDSLKTKEIAVIDSSKQKWSSSNHFIKDSTARIQLSDYKLNHLTYESNTNEKQFAVFSEIFYEEGWKAYINGEKAPHFRVNYVLRGMEIPSGNHVIEFKFEPNVIETGRNISLISYAFLILIPLGWFFYDRRKQDVK